MQVKGIVVQLEMSLNDFITIAREASAERVSIGEFIRKCIQQYLDIKYNPSLIEELIKRFKEGEKKETEK